MSKVRFAALLAVLTVALCWPSLYNQGPIWFFDSFAYLSGGRAAVSKVAHIDLDDVPGPVAAAGRAGAPAGGMPAGAAPDGASAAPGKGAGTGMATAAGTTAQAGAATATAAGGDTGADTVNVGRSVYFGVVLALVTEIFGLWGAPVLQSALFAAALVLFLSSYLPGRPWLVAAIGLATAGLTAAPLFTNYLMPDFLTGLAVLAMLRLLLPPARTWPETVAWAALLLFALVSHVSHILVGFGLFACSFAVLPLLRVRISRSGSATVAAILVLAVTAGMLFSAAVSKVTGTPPQRPPFLAARMIDDGPGMALLRDRCAGPDGAGGLGAGPYVYCRYMDRLPVDSVTFLWSQDPATGVFGAADAQTRQRMAHEQMPFALDVLRHYPLAQLRASLRLFREQLSRFGVEEFAYSGRLRTMIDRLLPSEQRGEVTATRFYANRFDLTGFGRVTRLGALAGLIVLVAANLAGLQRGRGPGPEAEAWRVLQAISLLIVLACLGNAAVTGILSEPFDRYQARIVWLLVVAAGLQLAALVPSRTSRRARLQPS